MKTDKSKQAQTFLQSLRDTGWIFFVCLLLFFCIFIFPIIFDDPAGSLRLLIQGEIRELLHLISSNILYYILGLILSIMGFIAIWVLLKLVDWTDKRLKVTKNILIKIVYWAVGIIVLFLLLLLLITFMKDMMV